MSIGGDEAIECSPECKICGSHLGYGTGPDIFEARLCVQNSVENHFEKTHPELDDSDIDANVDWHIR